MTGALSRAASVAVRVCGCLRGRIHSAYEHPLAPLRIAHKCALTTPHTRTPHDMPRRTARSPVAPSRLGQTPRAHARETGHECRQDNNAAKEKARNKRPRWPRQQQPTEEVHDIRERGRERRSEEERAARAKGSGTVPEEERREGEGSGGQQQEAQGRKKTTKLLALSSCCASAAAPLLSCASEEEEGFGGRCSGPSLR